MRFILTLLGLAVFCPATAISIGGCAPQEAKQDGDKPADKTKALVAEIEKALDEFCDGKQKAFRSIHAMRVCRLAQELGQERASEEILNCCRRNRGELLRIAILCRILFEAKAGGEFRRPMIGGAHFLAETDYPDWPLEPIELVDGVPLLIVQGYVLNGDAEEGTDYFRYCSQNCNGSKRPVADPSKENLEQALAKLERSPKWRRALDDREKSFLRAQILDRP